MRKGHKARATTTNMETFKACLRFVARLPAMLVILLLRGYKLFISPFLGNNCRFRPTCSEYMMQAVEKYGVFRGGMMGIWRIVRCNPWNPGGYDPP